MQGVRVLRRPAGSRIPAEGVSRPHAGSGPAGQSDYTSSGTIRKDPAERQIPQNGSKGLTSTTEEGPFGRAVQSLVSGEHRGDVAPARRQGARKPTLKQHVHTGRKNTKQAQVVALLQR